MSFGYGSFYIGFGVFLAVVVVFHMLLKRREREIRDRQREKTDSLEEIGEINESGEISEIMAFWNAGTKEREKDGTRDAESAETIKIELDDEV